MLGGPPPFGLTLLTARHPFLTLDKATQFRAFPGIYGWFGGFEKNHGLLRNNHCHQSVLRAYTCRIVAACLRRGYFAQTHHELELECFSILRASVHWHLTSYYLAPMKDKRARSNDGANVVSRHLLASYCDITGRSWTKQFLRSKIERVAGAPVRRYGVGGVPNSSRATLPLPAGSNSSCGSSGRSCGVAGISNCG